jgi:hypothetical protein
VAAQFRVEISDRLARGIRGPRVRCAEEAAEELIELAMLPSQPLGDRVHSEILARAVAHVSQ